MGTVFSWIAKHFWPDPPDEADGPPGPAGWRYMADLAGRQVAVGNARVWLGCDAQRRLVAVEVISVGLAVTSLSLAGRAGADFQQELVAMLERYAARAAVAA